MIRCVRRATLDNGLKVLIQEEHTAPLASVWCWYKVGSKDERPGLTGVSHWVEHMNFKGTTNIPRDQVKGIIEQFGGSWNGYTWIDQTTYLETATQRRARPDAVHRGRADGELPLPSGRLRVGAHGHHLGAAGRRERSRSAARSGADRDGVQGASLPPPDDRLAVGSADDDARRSVRLLPPLLRAQQRDAGRSSATSTPTRRCGASSSTSAASSRRPRPSGCAPSSRSRPASAG